MHLYLCFSSFPRFFSPRSSVCPLYCLVFHLVFFVKTVCIKCLSQDPISPLLFDCFCVCWCSKFVDFSSLLFYYYSYCYHHVLIVAALAFSSSSSLLSLCLVSTDFDFMVNSFGLSVPWNSCEISCRFFALCFSSFVLSLIVLSSLVLFLLLLF